MHISGVEIRNFRSFEHLKLTALPPTVVVLGENNAGKSNLLHALRLVLDPSLPDSARELDTDDFWDGSAGPEGGTEISVAVELSGFDHDVRAKAALLDSCISTEPPVAQLVYRWSQDADGIYSFTVTSGATAKEFYGARRRDIAMTVLPALRDAMNDLRSPHRSPLAALVRSSAVDADTLHQVSRQIHDVNATLLEDPALKQIEDDLAVRVKALVGDVHGIATALGVAPPNEEAVLRSLRLVVEQGFPLSRAGLGATNVIYLALLLNRVRSDKAIPGGSVSGLLAVEEPEAHLHAHVQRKVFSFFKADASVWLTTHAPDIASAADLDSVVVLRASGSPRSTVAVRAWSSELSEDDVADLERYLDIRRADLLFARGVVFVEGAAEQFLIPAVARSLGYDLDALGVSVCSVEGIDFAPYLVLARNLGLPHVVITDGDPKKDSNVPLGLLRGLRLLDGEAREAAEELWDDHEYTALRNALAEEMIFVNESTLEIEYARTDWAAIKSAYKGLGATRAKLDNLETFLAGALDGDSAAARAITSRLASRGKGRYAQRLAEHLSNDSHPEYLRDALTSLVAALE